MNDKEWDSLGNVLAFVLLLCVLLVLLAVVASVHGQTVTAIKVDMPMPPDLVHVSTRGCRIDGHDTGTTLDAKTGEETQNRLWTVTPFVKYVKLPNGEDREEWHPVNKDGTAKWIFSIPGTADFIPHEASDVCSAWLRELDKAKLKALHEAGK